MQSTLPYFKTPQSSASLSLPQDSDSLQESGPLNTLPAEILEKIFSYFNASSLARLDLVCQSWKQKVNNWGWQILLKQDYPRAYRMLSRYIQKESDKAVSYVSEESVAWSRAYKTWALKQESWHEEHCLKGHTDVISCITDLPDGQMATGSHDKTVRIWSPEGKELYVLYGHTSAIRCITSLPDGRLATGSDDCTVRIWSPEGKEHCLLQGHEKSVLSIACLQDGRLATGSWDQTVLIWSPKERTVPMLTTRTEMLCLTTHVLHKLCGHTDAVCCMILLPGGRLVSGSRDHTMRIWSLEGKELHVLSGHTDPINCITLLSDGRLATGSEDYTVRIWSEDSSPFVRDTPALKRRMKRKEKDFKSN